jgi:hypothetical protein
VPHAKGRPAASTAGCAQAHVDHTDGAKTFAKGHIADSQGITVTAEGVFIIPTRTLG